MNRTAAVPRLTDRLSKLRLRSGSMAPEHGDTTVLNADEAFAGARRGLGRIAWLIGGTSAALACNAPAGEARR